MRCIVVAVALLVGCTFSDTVGGEGEGEGEGPELCPAAGPCAPGQGVDDHGFCGDDGTWTPCVACAERWRDIDLGRTGIRCPDLPHADVVVAD